MILYSLKVVGIAPFPAILLSLIKNLMLYATTKSGHTISGHVSDSIDSLTVNLNSCYSSIEEVQADGHELYKCCEILGRKLPSSRVYTFLGGDAQEIAKYWGPK